MLLLGGGVFLGRHLAAAYRAAGWSVTAFQRGRTSAALPGVRVVHGDRATDLDRVAGTDWDTVVDTCGYLPAHVRLSAATLTYRRYVFISSISVYRSFVAPNTEVSPVVAPDDVRRITGAAYGPAKVACEQALAGRPALVVRCGLLTGPHDVSSAARFAGPLAPGDLGYDAFAGRVPYWSWRFGRPGPVLAPGSPDAPVQVLDARDLAGWLAAGTGTGVVNAVGPSVSLGSWLAAARGDRPAELRWVPDGVLLAAGVRPGLDLPLWEPTGSAFFAVRSAAVGLRHRPVSGTAADLSRWVASVGDLAAVGVDPLAPDREAALLQAGA